MQQLKINFNHCIFDNFIIPKDNKWIYELKERKQKKNIMESLPIKKFVNFFSMCYSLISMKIKCAFCGKNIEYNGDVYYCQSCGRRINFVDNTMTNKDLKKFKKDNA